MLQMNDLHIDDFYKDTAIILARLYSVFPRKTAVYVEDISGPDTMDEFGLHSDRHLACLSTLVWLSEEGYIRFEDTIRQEAIDQATLTHKGFTKLFSHVPQHLAEQQKSNPCITFIYAIKQSIQRKDSLQIKAIVEHYLQSNQ